MADSKIFDAQGIIEHVGGLSPEMFDVLNGDAVVKRVQKEFKNQSKEGREVAEKMAKNLKESGHNVASQLQRLQQEGERAGYNVGFTYDEKRREINVVMNRVPTVKGDAGANPANVRPLKFNIDVGSDKAGYQNGVPATKSLSFQKFGDMTAITTAIEDSLTAVVNTLEKANQNNKGLEKSTASLNYQMQNAYKNALKGLVAHTNHASVNNEYFEDERYEGDSRSRQQFMRTNAKMAGLIDTVIKQLAGENSKSFKSSNGKEINFNILQRDILTYIEVAQKKTLGKAAAQKMLQRRGYTEQDIKQLVSIVGDDILKLSNTVNLGSDRSMQTLTESYEGARDILLAQYGDSSRHTSQTRNTVSKVKGGKRKQVAFKEAGLQKDGYYKNNFEQEAYVNMRISQEDYQAAYAKVRERAEKAIRENLAKRNEKRKVKWSDEEIEKIVQSALRAQGMGDFAPSLDDDMAIAKRSSLQSLAGTRDRTTYLNEAEYDKYKTQAEEKIKRIVDDNSKNHKIKFGKRTYNLDDEKERAEYANAYIAVKAIHGMNPRDLYGGAEIGEMVDGLRSISVKQFVGGGQQEKILSSGERNYAFGLSDKTFKNVLKQLENDGVIPKGVADKVDFIKAGGAFKSNEMSHLAVDRLSYLYNQSKDKKAFLSWAQARNNPLSHLITGITDDGGIAFDQNEDNMKKFVEAGGLKQLYKLMAKTNVSQLGVDGDEKVFDQDAKAFIYESTAGLSDTFDWTQRVQTGSKERNAQQRTAAASKSTKGYADAISKRYETTNARAKSEVDKAKHDIEEIENAIHKKNTASSSMSEDEVAKYIKDNSYKTGDTSKHTITMGVGDNYTINTEKFKDVVAAYENGHLSKEEFDKTWEGEIENIRNEMIAAGIDPSLIDVVIDPGQAYGFSAYGSQYSGRLLHMGNIAANSMQDPLDSTKRVYNKSDYHGDVTQLFKAMGSTGPNKESNVSQAAADVIGGMFETAEGHHGAMYERANKRRLGHSKSFHTSGISPEDIESHTGIEKDRMIDSGFISKGAMKELLRDTFDYEREDGTIDEQAYLETLFAQFKDSEMYKSDSNTIKSLDDIQGDFKEKQNVLVKKLLEVAEKEGLHGMFNRFPSIDSEAVKNSRLFISKDLKDNDIMKVGSGLAKSINADFDGDTINVILKMIKDYSGDKTEDWDRKIMHRVYNMRGGPNGQKNKEERGKELQKALSEADNLFLKDVSGIAAKVNNQYIGSFSNMSTSVRNALEGTGYDERDAVYNADGKMNQNSFKKIAKGLIIKAVGQTLEQDAISAKKVEQRLVG